jgi:UDP-3-O-[3-hydroxymyristoyl] glucosamine N-acyltransferase
MTEHTVATLAALVGGRVVGDPDRTITGVGELQKATPQQLCFVRDAKYREAARTTAAGVVIATEPLETKASQIVVADVRLAFAKVASAFHPEPRAEAHRVHPTAVVHPDAVLEAPVDIGPHVVIGRARIGRGSVLMAGSVVEDGCRLGRDCTLYPNVVLYRRVELGNRVTAHSGTVIGSDGFGYAPHDHRWVKVPQLGTVVIADDVEIGAGCAVDRGALGDTRIGERTKIDNLCHIAHNCIIGADCAIAAACFLAGSTVLGDRVTFAGHVISAGHLNVPTDARIGGNSGLRGDVPGRGDWMGWPLQDLRRYGRTHVLLGKLDEMHAEIERLKARLDQRE